MGNISKPFQSCIRRKFGATQHRYRSRIWKDSINVSQGGFRYSEWWKEDAPGFGHHRQLSTSTDTSVYLVRCRGSCLWVVSTRFLLLDLDPRNGGRIQGIQEACRLHCCSKTIRQLEIRHLLLLERMLGLNLRCAGMILTLISLAEFDGVFKGLYFFSKGVFSNGPELMKRNKQA